MSTITIEKFARGFVAQLIDRGVTQIRPRSPNDRKGMGLVVQMLEGESERLTGAVRHDLIRLTNQLRPTSIGAYDGFLRALRDLQASLTSSPNPWYDEIVFNVSKPYAQSMLDAVDDDLRELVSKAASAFIRSTPETSR